jgi:hypothetical protein
MRSFIIPRTLPAFEIGASRAFVEAAGGRVLWTNRNLGTVVECRDDIAEFLDLIPRSGNPSTSGRKTAVYEVEIETVGNQRDGAVASMQGLLDVSAVDTVGELSF